MSNSQKIQIVVALIGAIAIIIAACIAVAPALFSFIRPPMLNSVSSPIPTACRTGVLCEVFPSTDDGEIFSWSDTENGLTSNFTSNCALSGSYGLQLNYGFLGDSEDGGWGVHWANTSNKYLDTRSYKELVFWVKGETGREKFQIGMKDSNNTEAYVQLNSVVVEISDWTMAVIPLDKFRPVRLESINNLSFGFNNTHGSGKICIDDIAFR